MTKVTKTPSQDRREFMKKAGKLAVTAPAAALILNTTLVSTASAVGSGGQTTPGTPFCQDDQLCRDEI